MADGLLDSNVLIAIVDTEHLHHAPSAELMIEQGWRLAVPPHAYAEAFSTLTKTGPRGQHQWSSQEAWTALDGLAGATELIGLTPGQSLTAVREYAATRGVGPRVYDYLIGRVATAHGIPAVITWNTSHFRSLFPQLRVETPPEFLARS